MKRLSRNVGVCSHQRPPERPLSPARAFSERCFYTRTESQHSRNGSGKCVIFPLPCAMRAARARALCVSASRRSSGLAASVKRSAL
eukprot:4328811-Prymnesium_polylepis.1